MDLQPLPLGAALVDFRVPLLQSPHVPGVCLSRLTHFTPSHYRQRRRRTGRWPVAAVAAAYESNFAGMFLYTRCFSTPPACIAAGRSMVNLSHPTGERGQTVFTSWLDRQLQLGVSGCSQEIFWSWRADLLPRQVHFKGAVEVEGNAMRGHDAMISDRPFFRGVPTSDTSITDTRAQGDQSFPFSA